MKEEENDATYEAIKTVWKEERKRNCKRLAGKEKERRRLRALAIGLGWALCWVGLSAIGLGSLLSTWHLFSALCILILAPPIFFVWTKILILLEIHTLEWSF